MIVQDSYSSSLEESEAISILADNLLKLKNQMVEYSLQQEVQTNRISQTQPSHQQSQFEARSEIALHYKQFSQSLPSSYKSMTYEDKIQYLLSKKELGALVHLFEIIYYFRQALPPQLLINISQSLTQNLNFESELEIRCMFELLSYIGVVDQMMLQNIYKLVLEESLPFDIGFLFLVNMGIMGFEILTEIAGGEFNGLPLQALSYLARSEVIIQEIVIPSVMNDLSSSIDPKKKTTALTILSKFHNLTASPKIMSKLVKLYEDEKEANDKNRNLIASILRSSGMQGEKQLTKLLKSANNNRHKIPLINVMAWKVPNEIQLQIEVIEYTIASGFTPGSMFRYSGNLEPSSLNHSAKEADTLYLNSRDFLASLNRFIGSQAGETARNQKIRVQSFNCSHLSTLIKFVRGRQKNDNRSKITQQAVKCLNTCLNNPIVQIREATLKALGNIGLPQAADSLDRVVKCLSDPDSRNRSMACWTISKICRNPSNKIVKKLVQLLKDSFWKVRTESCLTLSVIVEQPDEFLVAGLIRALKDGSINRQTVCQTIIQLGPIGQQILVDLLKLTHPSDTKVISAIISSFSLANVESPTIDYLIEQLFKHCSHQNSSVRAQCLECLNHLRIKSSQGNVTYLKAKNILPLFYFFLEDPSPKLRELAVQSILSFGSHAELIFIEGVTKSSNPLIRSQCVKGLAQMGVQNFRAILFGLRDNDTKVRAATSAAILNHLNIEDVINEFEEKNNHIPTLCCHLTQILEGYSLGNEIQQYLYYLLQIFKNKKQGNKRTLTNYNQNEDNNY